MNNDDSSLLVSALSMCERSLSRTPVEGGFSYIKAGENEKLVKSEFRILQFHNNLRKYIHTIRTTPVLQYLNVPGSIYFKSTGTHKIQMYKPGMYTLVNGKIRLTLTIK